MTGGNIVNTIEINEARELEIAPLFKNLESYNYLELMVAKKSVKEYKTLMKEINAAKGDLDNLYEMIDEINSINDTDLSIEKVDEDKSSSLYDEMGLYEKRIEYTDEIIDKLLSNYDGIDKNRTSFIISQTIESLKHQISALEKSNDINREYKISVLNQKLMAFENPSSFSYMVAMASYTPRVKALAKEYKKNPTKGRKMVRRNMKGIYSEQSLAIFEKYLISFFSQYNIPTTYQKMMIPELVMYFIAKFIRNERASGKYAYAKAMMGICIDIERGFYDLGNPEDIEKAFLDFINTYILNLA